MSSGKGDSWGPSLQLPTPTGGETKTVVIHSTQINVVFALVTITTCTPHARLSYAPASLPQHPPHVPTSSMRLFVYTYPAFCQLTHASACALSCLPHTLHRPEAQCWHSTGSIH